MVVLPGGKKKWPQKRGDRITEVAVRRGSTEGEKHRSH